MLIFHSYVSLPEGNGDLYIETTPLRDSLVAWIKTDQNYGGMNEGEPTRITTLQIPSGKLWKDPPFLMGKSTINSHFQ